MLFLIYLASYWIIAGFYAFLDFYGDELFPDFYYKYKIQDMSRNKTKELYYKCIPIVLRNQFTVDLLGYSLLDFDNSGFFPSLLNFILNSTINVLLFTGFHYMTHKYFYFIHKKHHELKNPICVNAEYCSFIEEIINQTIVMHISCYFLKMNYWFMVLYIVSNNMAELSAHSGYKFSSEIRRHYLHHKKFKVNYGTFRFIDEIFGTNLD